MREKLRNRRKELGLTVEKFAEMADISSREMKSIEQGIHMPRLEIGYKIVKILCGEDGMSYYEWNPEKLSEARERMNMTQQCLADKIGVSRRSVSRWENTKKLSQPSITQLIIISRILGVPEGDFFTRKERKICTAI